MTTDTLKALKRAYRNGSISVVDEHLLIEELLRRNDAVENGKEAFKQVVTEAVSNLVGLMDDSE